MRITKEEFEAAAAHKICLICGRIFERESDAKIHMVKIHVMERNSHYVIVKTNQLQNLLIPEVDN